MTHADSLKIMSIMDEIRKQLGVKYEEDDICNHLKQWTS